MEHVKTRAEKLNLHSTSFASVLFLFHTDRLLFCRHRREVWKGTACCRDLGEKLLNEAGGGMKALTIACVQPKSIQSFSEDHQRQ